MINMQTILKGRTKEVEITTDGPVTIIGESINPTRRKKLTAALLSGQLDYVFELAKTQIETGADVLDINVGAPGVDEETMLPQVAQAVAERFDVPICLDSSNRAALAAALKVVPGKPLINSVNGEEANLTNLLPIIKEYGAAVIGLTMDDNGIPTDPEVRLRIAAKILERAAKLGIPAEDVVIDPLVLTVGADQKCRASNTRYHPDGTPGIWGQHQPGCQQCFFRAPRPAYGQPGFPGNRGERGCQLRHHQPGKTNPHHPRLRSAARA